ncbi:hypothetical protein SESBI_39237 [Sesbania bispinosa]|nr:hypothetical protein SESBI_39237 [Sesbania bispinosa]
MTIDIIEELTWWDSDNEGAATGKGLAATIEEDGEVIGRNIVCEPLIDEEDGLGAGLMGSSGSSLDVVTESTMVGPGSVGGEVETANWGGDTRSAAREGVEIGTLEVSCGFHPSPHAFRFGIQTERFGVP